MTAVISNEEKQAYEHLLAKRGATRPCCRCGGTKMFMMDGFFNNPVFRNESEMLRDRIVPTIVMGCATCGNIYQHALEVLNMPLQGEVN